MRDLSQVGRQEGFADDHFGGCVSKYASTNVDNGGKAFYEFEDQSAAKDDNRYADKKAHDNEGEVVLCGPCDSEHIVQSHEGVCNDDGFERTPKADRGGRGMCMVIGTVWVMGGIVRFEEFDGNPDESQSANEFEPRGCE